MQDGICKIRSNGKVLCVVSDKHITKCIPDLTYFPFDTQNCTFWYGCWTSLVDEIKLEPLNFPVSLKKLTENPTYKLLGRNVVYYNGNYNDGNDTKTYISVYYSFQFQREVSILVAGYLIPGLGEYFLQK